MKLKEEIELVGSLILNSNGGLWSFTLDVVIKPARHVLGRIEGGR